MSKVPTSDRKSNLWRRSGAHVVMDECAHQRPKFENKLVLKKRDGEE